MANIIGHFFFKITTNGNLIGEFSNSGMEVVDTECANTCDGSEGFQGNYMTVWEDGKMSHRMELTIDFKQNSNHKIHTLIWKKGGRIKFWGEGFIVDGILIGSYRNFNPIP